MIRGSELKMPEDVICVFSAPALKPAANELDVPLSRMPSNTMTRTTKMLSTTDSKLQIRNSEIFL